MTEDARGGIEQLSAYLDGELKAAEREAVARRIEADPSARQELEELANVARVLASAPRPAPPRDYRALFAPRPWWTILMSWTPALAGSAAAILLAVGIVGAIASTGGSARMTTPSVEALLSEVRAVDGARREVATEGLGVQTVEVELPVEASEIQAVEEEGAPSDEAVVAEDTAAAPIFARIKAVERPQETQGETEAETVVEAPVAVRAPTDELPEASGGSLPTVAETVVTAERAGPEVADPAAAKDAIRTAEPAGTPGRVGLPELTKAEAPVANPTPSPGPAEPTVEWSPADLGFWPYPLAAGAVLLVLTGTLWRRQRARR